jgi:hypothetical protein
VTDEERRAVIDKWHRDGTYMTRLWDSLPASLVIRNLDMTEQRVLDINSPFPRKRVVAQ